MEPGGQARKLVLDQQQQETEAALVALPWRGRVTWRQGTKGAFSAGSPIARVRTDDDGAVRGNNRHQPDDEGWLVGERGSSNERNSF